MRLRPRLANTLLQWETRVRHLTTLDIFLRQAAITTPPLAPPLLHMGKWVLRTHTWAVHLMELPRPLCPCPSGQAPTSHPTCSRTSSRLPWCPSHPLHRCHPWDTPTILLGTTLTPTWTNTKVFSHKRTTSSSLQSPWGQYVSVSVILLLWKTLRTIHNPGPSETSLAIVIGPQSWVSPFSIQWSLENLVIAKQEQRRKNARYIHRNETFLQSLAPLHHHLISTYNWMLYQFFARNYFHVHWKCNNWYWKILFSSSF